MHLLAVLTEELESRPDDADRVDALTRHLRAVGRDAGALACEWLVKGARSSRPARLTQAALANAASRLAAAAGTSPWLFEVGRDASTEAAEAIALLLPWPPAHATGDTSAATTRPALADWLASWRSAAGQSDPAQRALGTAAAIAALDDPLTRRWAVRAVCGLVRPMATEWQWQRAWALAFDLDPHALAWAWHRDGRLHPATGNAAEPALFPPMLHFPLRPRAVAPLADASEPAHAALLAAWQRDELWAEPRWSGLRVQIVRQGGDVAVWRQDGGLLNAALPLAWLAASWWPDPCVIDGVLIGWRDGRGVDVAEAEAAVDAALTRPAGARKPVATAPTVSAVTLHLVLTDWHRWADDDAPALAATERRARLHARWPASDLAADAGTRIGTGRGDADALPPPPVFTTPSVPLPRALARRGHASELAAIATAARAAGWAGLVLRARHAAGHAHADPAPASWRIRAPLHRVRAVLQYVPSEALGAGAAAASALAVVACGFALWNREPLAEDERAAAMTAAMSGAFLPPPSDTGGIDGLRLLPLARLPLALPDDELQAIHAWLRAHAGQRFGAMQAVAPALVFELGFTGVRDSRRHKIGLALAGARVLRWLRDAPPGSAHRAVDVAVAVAEDTDPDTRHDGERDTGRGRDGGEALP